MTSLLKKMEGDEEQHVQMAEENNNCLVYNIVQNVRNSFLLEENKTKGNKIPHRASVLM